MTEERAIQKLRCRLAIAVRDTRALELEPEECLGLLVDLCGSQAGAEAAVEKMREARRRTDARDAAAKARARERGIPEETAWAELLREQYAAPGLT